ncbi:MAG TPA: hypothetical protein DCY88_09620, partial [Cyanobacteria bacterium UBA11372]|nr:hypothetical protein [Cyanobacteria bacterium UBA11372]
PGNENLEALPLVANGARSELTAYSSGRKLLKPDAIMLRIADAIAKSAVKPYHIVWTANLSRPQSYVPF